MLFFGSWPLAVSVIVVFFLLLFRKPIEGLFGRMKRLGFGDKAIDLAEDRPQAVAEQQQELPVVNKDMVPADHAMPDTNEALAPVEQELRANLEKLSLPHDLERAWLVRGVANFRVAHAHEVTYRIILGSQIALLNAVNTGNSNIQTAHAIYDAATATVPDFYAHFDFDTWIKYPLGAHLLVEEAASPDQPRKLRITPIGKDFLRYMVTSGLPQKTT